MTIEQDFTPRWASSPGATIRDLISSKNANPNDVAAACGLGLVEFENLLRGDIPITGEVASSLAVHLGGSTSFWLRRERRYRESATIVEADQWVESLPLTSMKKMGWLDVPKEWHSRIDACLEFFGADSLDEWKHTYARQLEGVRFRTSPVYTNQVSSVSTWLRAGEIASRAFGGGEFNSSLLLSLLGDFRSLTRVPDPRDYIPSLRALAAECGVAFVLVPAPEGCAASGASRILSDGSAIIQLSGRYLSDDQFWFSFFHEVGHLILHQDSVLHVDGDPTAFEASHEEEEANTFSADVLWPFEDRPCIRSKPSRRDIFRLASEVGTSPGILVGQLQATGTLAHAEYNNLKRRYKRDGDRLVLKN